MKNMDRRIGELAATLYRQRVSHSEYISTMAHPVLNRIDSLLRFGPVNDEASEVKYWKLNGARWLTLGLRIPVLTGWDLGGMTIFLIEMRAGWTSLQSPCRLGSSTTVVIHNVVLEHLLMVK